MADSDRSKDDLISNFCGITGVETERGQFYLESANWNLQLAIQSFFEHSAEDAERMDTNPNPTPQLNEEQERAQQLQQMFSNQPIIKTHSSDEESSEEMSSPKPNKKSTTDEKEVPKRSTSSKFATLDSLKRQTDSGGSSGEEEGQAFYAGGSERSGQQVLGPKKKNTDEFVSHMFASAKEHGAEVVDPSEEAKLKKRVNAFVGTGFKLGSSSEPSSAIPSSSTQRPQNREVVLRFWRNGFTLDDGPLRDFNEPQSVVFLQSVTRGEIPRELIQKYPGNEIHVSMEDRKHEEYVPPKRNVQVFAGEGHRLGNPTAEVVSSVGLISSTDPKVNEEEALKRLNIDQSQPTTNIQIRLSDGTRIVVKVNVTHTIADIRQFICNSRPIYSTQTFILMTTFPNKELTDENLTIKDANLLNALIVQKIQ